MSKPLPHESVEYWMLLEFCPNGSLIDVIYRKDRSGNSRGDPLFQRLASSSSLRWSSPRWLTCTRRAAGVHRDLKLENVLGTADGRYVLCDFGSATTATLPAERTRREAVVEEERIHKYSTLMYRAPEMVDMYRNQEVGVKVDVWSLGCILYSLCFREHPFAEESSLQILNAAYTIPADSPYLPRMHKLIAALLQPDPAVRPHAKDVLAAVQRLRAAEATEGSKAPASAKSPAPATPSSAGSARSQARTHALHANSSESSGGAAPHPRSRPRGRPVRLQPDLQAQPPSRLRTASRPNSTRRSSRTLMRRAEVRRPCARGQPCAYASAWARATQTAPGSCASA